MPYKQIGSPDPRYLAATDVLIGDMSDINYEFLLYDRPIVLLANQWLGDHFPDIGIKTNLESLGEAIKESIANPGKHAEQRKYWLDKTIYKPDGNSSNRVIDAIIEYSKINDPVFVFIHGNNEVLKTHLISLYEAAKTRNIKSEYTDYFHNERRYDIGRLIFISANNTYIKDIKCGYKVHIDHGVKGIGVTDFEKQCIQYDVFHL